MAMQWRALEALELLSPEKMNARDIIRMIIEAVKIEREARGTSTTITMASDLDSRPIDAPKPVSEKPVIDVNRMAAITQALLEAGILDDERTISTTRTDLPADVADDSGADLAA